MLRAEELMVGDLVYAIDINGEKHPCRANNLEYDYTNKRGDFCVDFYGTGYEAEWPDITFNVEPIPLTPEIFRSIGFKDIDHDGDCDGSDIYWLNGDGYSINTQDLHLHCVHELQHALRLCGIDKTIEL